jgi:glutamyl-Q tRNA(Asp) synthetase
MDDLDPPREQAGAASCILKSLECHGLLWDEEVMWQSKRSATYEDALATLAARGLLFHCKCPRKRLNPGGACSATCRAQQQDISSPWATRIDVETQRLVEFEDRLQGPQSIQFSQQQDDFVVKRRDGLYAYQLAVVVDDASQMISHIVRGSDLMPSTGRQIYLQGVLGITTPHYCHLPVITNSQGQKFSKQSHAPPLGDKDAAQNLRRALAFLQQASPPAELTGVGPILDFACGQWSMNRVPHRLAIPATRLDGIV